MQPAKSGGVDPASSSCSPYAKKKASDAGSTQREARKGSASAPAEVTTIASFRLARMVRLKLAQKKMSASGSSFCHSLTGGSALLSDWCTSFIVSMGTCAAPDL